MNNYYLKTKNLKEPKLSKDENQSKENNQ